MVGPVHSGAPDVLSDRRTPGVGLDPVRYAARHAPTPFFVGGGLDVDGARAVLDAGARRLSVGACVTGADDPSAVVWSLRRLLGATHG